MVIARLQPATRERMPEIAPAVAAPARAATVPALSVAGVSHRYGATRVLDDVGLTVAPGEILCLVGPSGCGKSTTLRLVAGLEPIESGRIAIAGRSSEERRGGKQGVSKC